MKCRGFLFLTLIALFFVRKCEQLEFNGKEEEEGSNGNTKSSSESAVENNHIKHFDNNETIEEQIKHVCKILNISSTNCTCHYIHNTVGMKGFCQTPTTEKKKKMSKLPTTCFKSTIKIVENSSIIFIAFLGIIGNILVLTVRVRNWKKSLHYQLISGLAMADLTFSCTHMVTSFPYIWMCNWPFGNVLCTLLRTLLGLSSNIDLGFILIIAIERYIGIVHPFTGGASAYKIYIMTCINFLAGFLAVVPLLFVIRLDSNVQCVEDWSLFSESSSIIYGWLTNVFFFLIPIVATCVLYYQSLRTLKSTLFRQEMMVTLDETSRKKLISENSRILSIISMILIAFFFLVGPNHITWFIKDNFIITETFSTLLFTISAIAYTLHTSINPIIYSVIDRKFRRNIYYLLRHRRRRKSFNTTATATNLTPLHQMHNIEQNNSLTSSHIEHIEHIDSV